MQKQIYFLITGLLIGAVLFAGCTPNPAASQETSTVHPAPTALATETFTLTVEPSPTSTFTLTPEPTATLTPTITPSPTPNMVMPGSFGGGGCRTASMSQGGELEFCVTGVTVDGGISLYGAGTYQTLNYKDFPLEHYPLLLRYIEEAWQPSAAPDGSVVLANKSMPTYTIWSLPTREPQGEHKSTIAVGAITYAIYGYFDSTNNFYVREYIYQSGLARIDPNSKPFFFVTIPADNSMNCIYDVSDVLSSLAPKAP